MLTNGEGIFDTPNPYGESSKPRNYTIDAPGTWQLTCGVVCKLTDGEL